jgi:hypothetical protein
MRRLVRPFDGHVEVSSLLGSQRGKLHPDLREMQAGNFLVELLGQDIDAGLVGVLVLPEIELGEGLVRKLLLITKDGWPVAQPRFTKAAFGEEEYLLTGLEGVLVDLAA